MHCNDKFLRQMLHSPYGEAIAEAICTRLDEGKTVTVTNGGELELSTREQALQTFREEFNWYPNKAA
jgi:hypothetical protein